MPHTIRRTPDEARITTQLDEIAGTIQHGEDLSATMMVVADRAGREENAIAMVSDPAACALSWRRVAAVDPHLQESLALVQAAAEALHGVAPRATSGAS